MKRSTIAEDCNCAFAMRQTRHVSTFQASAVAATAQSACLVDTVEVNIPVLTNMKALAAGDELVVYWKKTVRSTQTAKTRTWQDAAAQEFRQAKKTAKMSISGSAA